MDVYLTRRTRLRVPPDDVLDRNGPQKDLRGLAYLMERIQHSLAARPTGHLVQVQLAHAPKGCGIKPGKDLVRQQGMHPPGCQEVVILRINSMPSGTEIWDELVSHVRQCGRHLHSRPAAKPPVGVAWEPPRQVE